MGRGKKRSRFSNTAKRSIANAPHPDEKGMLRKDYDAQQKAKILNDFSKLKDKAIIFDGQGNYSYGTEEEKDVDLSGDFCGSVYGGFQPLPVKDMFENQMIRERDQLTKEEMRSNLL